MPRVVSMINPVTRSTVKIDPPFEYELATERDEFVRLFGGYCIAAWDLAFRADPKTASADDVMAGRMLPDCPTAVHEALRPLVAAYGVLAVQHALQDILNDKIGVRMEGGF